MIDQRPTLKHGFTLIELLIVVAIIVILVAIAIPNLLEAQSRARVARSKADLRTLAIALESYRTDNTVYPLARTFCTGMLANVADYNVHPPELTSPIAYVTAPIEDVFNRDRQYKYIRPGRGWSNQVMTILALWVPKNFPACGSPADDIPYFDGNGPLSWALWSVGPSGALPFDQSDTAHFPVPSRTWYDPTNGTVSSGVVTRLGSGKQS